MASYSAPYGLAVGLIFGLAFGLDGGLIYGLIAGLVCGVVGGIPAGLEAGGWYLLLQRDTRKRADNEDLLPSDPLGFVRAAVEVGILRQTGGGVQFRHRVIADRLAAEAPTPGLADLQTPRSHAGRCSSADERYCLPSAS